MCQQNFESRQRPHAMKAVLTVVALISWLGLLTETIWAQDWVKMMEDRNANFYDIQREFNAYWQGKTVTKGSGWKPFKRWEAFIAPRVYPTGTFPDPDQASKAFLQYQASQNPVDPEAFTGYWTGLGPSSWTAGPNGYNPGNGRVNCIAVHPTNSSIIFVGTASGGLWKSTDGGSSWSTSTDNLNVLGVTSVVIDPANPNIMYIATGDGDMPFRPVYSLGVLKSTDGGNTWNSTGLSWTVTQNRFISKLLIHPTNSNILLAATDIGVYKTSDAGVNWPQTQAGNFKDLEFNPSNPAIVYVCGTQFYRSNNTGDSFTLITSGLPAASAVNRMAIAVTPANASYVYLVAGNASNSAYNGLYQSTTNGASFTLKSSSPNILGGDINGSLGNCGTPNNPPCGQSWYDLAIAVSPTNANEVYVGGVNIWKSTDGGSIWSIKSHWTYPPTTVPYVHADIHALDFSGSTLYSGNDGGLFKTTNGGSSWTDLSAGLSIMQFYRIGGFPANPNLIYGGAQDNGINRYNGAWTHVFGADGMECIIDPNNSNLVYISSQNGDLRKSTDGGNSFNSILQNGITGAGAWVTPFVMDPTNSQMLYAGFQNIWKTTNGGASWFTISSFTGGSFDALAVAPSNTNFIYASSGNTIFRTSTGGGTWTNITAGLPNLAITYIAVSEIDHRKLWVTLSGYFAGNKVYASTDSGATWTNFSGALPNLPFNCIAYANSSNDELYIGGDIGIYYRDNTMADWQLFNTGLPNVIIKELQVHKDSGTLVAATHGRGLWRSFLALPTVSIGDTTVNEGDFGTAYAYFTVSLSATSAQTIEAVYETADNTAAAGSDYVAVSDTVFFPRGTRTLLIGIAINGDQIIEPDESFFVNLTSANLADLGDTQGKADIINDDLPVTLSIDDVTVNEGTGPVYVNFTASLSAPSQQGVSFSFTTAEGTATGHTCQAKKSIKLEDKRSV